MFDTPLGSKYYESSFICWPTNSYFDYNKMSKCWPSTGSNDARTTAQLQQQSTFTSWDFSSIWAINEGSSYPYLRSIPFVFTGTLASPSLPQTPTGLESNTISTNSFNLTFNQNVSTDNVTGYNIYINNSQYGATIQTSPQAITGLQPNTNYAVNLTAINISGESDQSTTIYVTTAAVPIGPSLGSRTPYSVTLNWPAYTGATSYNILQNNVQIGQTKLLTYTIYNLNPSTTYSFKITANTGSGPGPDPSPSTPYSPITVTTQPTSNPSPTPPAAPTNPQQGVTTPTSATISWTPPAGVPSPTYTIRDGGVIIAITPNPTITLPFQPGTTHPITITTVATVDTTPPYTDPGTGITDPATPITSESQPTAPISVQTRTSVPPIQGSTVTQSNPSPTSITLTWPSYTTAISYTIYENGNLIGNTTLTTYTVNNLVPNTNYIFTITIVTSEGESMPSDPVPVTTAPGHLGIQGDAPPVVLCSPDKLHYWDPISKSEKDLSATWIYNQYDLSNLVPGTTKILIYQFISWKV